MLSIAQRYHTGIRPYPQIITDRNAPLMPAEGVLHPGHEKPYFLFDNDSHLHYDFVQYATVLTWLWCACYLDKVDKMLRAPGQTRTATEGA